MELERNGHPPHRTNYKQSRRRNDRRRPSVPICLVLSLATGRHRRGDPNALVVPSVPLRPPSQRRHVPHYFAPSPAGEYLSHISGPDDGDSDDNEGVEEEAGKDWEECDDDDYEMSPVSHPNEEPPGDDGAAATPVPTATIYEGAVKNSKFEAPATAPTAADEEDGAGAGAVKSFVRNLLGGDAPGRKSREETTRERERRWGEWMASGRRDRTGDGGAATDDDDDDDPTGLSTLPPGASLPRVDEGADYVVVAVPADAVAGLGPVLPSFPGGSSFQRTLGKSLRQVAAGDRKVDRGGGNSTSATAGSAAPAPPKRKKQPQTKGAERKRKQPRAKGRGSGKRPAADPRGEETDAARKRKRRRSQYVARRREFVASRREGRISSNDWLHNMINLPGSTILRDVRGPVSWTFAWATSWSVLHRWCAAAGMGGSRAARLVGHMCLPPVQHTMMVSALSFLLVFRTNSAYQRFAEGRKIWNDIVDTARDFSRMIKLYEFAIGASKCRRINSLLASFPYLLRHRIRPSLMSGMFRVSDAEVERDPENSLLLYPDESLRDTDPDAAALASAEEETGSSRRKTRELCWVDRRTLPWKLIPGAALGPCARAQNRPLWVCDRMAKELSAVTDLPPTFTNRERLALIGYCDKLSRSIGACERIHQTVVPLNYARHALRSLTVWLWTLPFVFVKDLGLLTGPVVGVLSWILFGVYEIGSRIEDPFQGTLRLSIYCDSIRRDVLADAIARDTAFDLEEEKQSSSANGDSKNDAIFEIDSESEEYDGDDGISTKKKKKEKKGRWHY